ncbi:MAG: choice-of-anchor L domain-containing protein [Chitinophagales bacterium]
MIFRKLTVCFVFLMTAIFGMAQITLDTSATALQMAKFLAGSGITVSNAKLHCAAGSSGKFNGGLGVQLGIEDGVVLSSGNVLDISYPADGNGSLSTQPISTITNDSSDADLQVLATNNDVHDACVLEFDMDVDGDSLKFNYVFASEEYPEYVCGTVNDIFAFFLSGPKPGGGNYTKVNIAKIPGTNLPVTINSLNPGVPGANVSGTCNGPGESLAYSSLYTDNSGNPGLAFDGLTHRLRAIAPTVPCESYHLKIALGDVGDEAFDSGVFLEARSISSTNVSLVAGVTPGNFVNAVEGCNSSGFKISIDRKLSQAYTLNYSIGGAATSGSDYTPVSNAVTFQLGDTTAYVTIDPIADHISEPNESVILYLLNSCNNLPYDSAVIYIQDSVVAISVTPDDTICRGESTLLLAQGANHFKWTPANGLSSDTLATIVAAPSTSTKYFVRADVGPCYDIDSVTIIVRDAEYTVEAGPDDTICLNDAALIHLQFNGNQAPYNIQWFGKPLSDSTSADPVANPVVSTTYQVLVTGKNGCTQRDSIRVVINGVGPQVVVRSDKNDVCFGDTIHLEAEIFPVSCGIAANPCGGLVSQGTVGNGTVTFGSTPFESSFRGERIQMLYRADELTAAGVKPGTITDIGFDVFANGSGGAAYNGLSMKMGCTDQDHMNSNFISGLTLVTQPAPYIILGTGIFPVTLDNQYNWDGHSNLVIEICWDNTTSTSNDDRVNATTTSYPSVAIDEKFSGPQAGCNLNNPFTSNSRPNILITYCPAPPVSYQIGWTPAAGLTQPDSLKTAVALDHNQVYVMTASDGQCNGRGIIDLHQRRYAATAIPDTAICEGNSVMLNVKLSGDLPLQPINCGSTAINCSGPDVRYVLDSTNNTIFTGPFDYFGEDSRQQILYRKSDLLAAGAKPGSISSLAFKVASQFSGRTHSNLNIKLGCTDKDTMSLDIGWIPVTQVLSLDSFTALVGWNEFNFDNTYNWDGNSNLVVDVCWDNPDGSDFPQSAYVLGEPVGYDCNLLATSDLAHGCALNIINAFSGSERPMIRFKMCPAPLAPVTYNWASNSSLSATTVSNPVATPATTQSYSVTATFADGCTRTDTVTVVTAPSFQVTPAFRDTLIETGATIAIPVDASVSGVKFQWQPNLYLDVDTGKLVHATPNDSIVYRILANNGFCSMIDSVAIHIKAIHRDTFAFVMPNAFTPNGDGVNDLFFPVFKNGKTPPVKAFRIYNRWGEMVYDNPTQGWDGRLNGMAQPSEQYTYFFSVELETGKEEHHIGNVTLLR